MTDSKQDTEHKIVIAISANTQILPDRARKLVDAFLVGRNFPDRPHQNHPKGDITIKNAHVMPANLSEIMAERDALKAELAEQKKLLRHYAIAVGFALRNPDQVTGDSWDELVQARDHAQRVKDAKAGA